MLERAIQDDDMLQIGKVQNSNRIMLLSDELMNKIAKMQKKNIAVEILNQALKDYVEKVGIQNIVMQEKFSTKFQKIATAYNERTSVEDIEKIIQEMINLKNEIEKELAAGNEYNLSVEEKAFFDALGNDPQVKELMKDETLVKIGRAHSVCDIVDCFNMAREIGFDNINMDLILGLVDEDLEMVRNTLEEIKKLNPESLTVHTLAVKRASKLKEDIENYELTRYEEKIKMIDLSMEYAKEMGLNPYYMYRQKHMLGNLENIGYAKEGYECIYNIQIMEEKQSNYALGAGSISKFVYVDEDRIERVENVKNVEQYIDRVDEMIERKRKEIYQNVN